MEKFLGRLGKFKNITVHTICACIDQSRLNPVGRFFLFNAANLSLFVTSDASIVARISGSLVTRDRSVGFVLPVRGDQIIIINDAKTIAVHR